MNLVNGENGMPKKQLDWPLLDFDTHGGLRTLISDLNTLYREEPSLHQVDFDWKGFRWINAADYEKKHAQFHPLQ